MKHLILIFLSLLFINSCAKKGSESTIEFNVQSFNTIELNSLFDVVLIEDTLFSVKISGDEDFIRDVKLEVKDTVLSIINLKSNKFLSPKNSKVKLIITSKPLKRVIVNETCNIKTQTPITSNDFGIVLKSKLNIATLELECNTFYYWNNRPCGGKLTLSGKVKDLVIWNTALLAIDAKELTTNNAQIEQGSQGDIEVTVLNKFEYQITNVGNIHLYGNPSQIILKNNNTVGSLIIH